MSRSALQRVQSAFIADAPATVDMTLAQACRHALGQAHVDSPWDKSFLDGYPGEPGFSRRTRALILLACVPVSWALFAAPVVAVLGLPSL